jgi:glycosyltransferase involved in cell wall biosynthesis
VLVNGSDVGEIAAKIMTLLGDETLRLRIGKNGRELVSSYLTWDRCAAKTEALYRELLQGPATSCTP